MLRTGTAIALLFGALAAVGAACAALPPPDCIGDGYDWMDRGGSVFADTVSVFVSGLSHRFPRQFPLPSGGVTAGRAVGRPERTPLDGVAIMRPPPSLAG